MSDMNLIRPSPSDNSPLRKRSFSQPESVSKSIQKRNSNQAASPFITVECTGNIPGERYGHSACVDYHINQENDIMYIFGGCNSNHNHFSDELFAYNIGNKQWNLIEKPIKQESNENVNVQQKHLWPQGRHFHSAVTYRNFMIIFGGKSNGYRNDIYSFNYKTKLWQEIVPQGEERISRRYGHCAVIYNESMFIFGGYDDYGLTCNDLWEFSFNTNEWHKVKVLGIPPERYHHSGVVFEGSLYVFGGFQGYDDLYEYRFGSRTWSVVNTKGAPPNPRWGHKAIAVKRYMYIFGGCDLVINYNDLHRFHFDTSRWEKLPSGGYTQGYFQTVIENNNRIYIFGGKNVHNYNFNDLFEYRFDVEAKANPNTFEEDFRNMLFDNDFADVIFSFPKEGRQIKAHRFILFARSNKFRELISTKPGRFSSNIKNTKEEIIITHKIKKSRTKSSPSQNKHEKTRKKRKKSRSRKKLEKLQLNTDIMDTNTNNNKYINEEIIINDKRKETIEIKKKEKPEEIIFKDSNLFVVEIFDVKYDIYRRFLEYTYSGYFDMSQPYAFDLLNLASNYGMEHLKTMCVVKIQTSIDTKNVLEALQLAYNCKVNDLKSFCLSFIAEHRAEVTPALRKGELHPDILKEVRKWLTVQNLEKPQANSSPIYQPILT